jgi:hypothetical protein
MAPEIVRPVVVPSWDSTPKGSTGGVGGDGAADVCEGLKGPVVEVDFFRLTSSEWEQECNMVQQLLSPST